MKSGSRVIVAQWSLVHMQHCSVEKCVIVASIVRDGSSCLDSKIVYIIHFCCWLHDN